MSSSPNTTYIPTLAESIAAGEREADYTYLIEGCSVGGKWSWPASRARPKLTSRADSHLQNGKGLGISGTACRVALTELAWGSSVDLSFMNRELAFFSKLAELVISTPPTDETHSLVTTAKVLKDSLKALDESWEAFRKIPKTEDNRQEVDRAVWVVEEKVNGLDKTLVEHSGVFRPVD